MSYSFAGPNNILKKMRAKKVQLLCTAAFSLIILPGLADAKSRDLYYSRIKPWLTNAAREDEAVQARVIELRHADQGRVLPYQKPLPWLKQENEARGLPASYVPSFHQEEQVAIQVAPKYVPLVKASQEIVRNPEPEYIEEERVLARNEEQHIPEKQEAPRTIMLMHRDEETVSVKLQGPTETSAPMNANKAGNGGSPVQNETVFEEIAVIEVAPQEVTAEAMESPVVQQAEAAPVEQIASIELSAAIVETIAPISAEQEPEPRVIHLKPAPIAEATLEQSPTEVPEKEIPALVAEVKATKETAPVDELIPAAIVQATPEVQTVIQDDQAVAESALYPENETVDAEGDFDTASNVPAEELGEVRGGFIASNGMQIDIGFETRTIVDGALAEQTVVPNIENLKASDLQNLIQVNNAASSARKLNLNDMPNIMTIIQNSRNDVKIDSYAIMNIDVSNSARFQMQTMAPEMFNIQAINNLR